jgi:hypothetical protein
MVPAKMKNTFLPNSFKALTSLLADMPPKY